MRRALLVGIDNYALGPLAGCVNDATRLGQLLARDESGDPNFSCKLLTAGGDVVTRFTLRQRLEELFAQPADAALFYFSGHGTANNLGGYLVTQDATRYDEGVAMRDVLDLATASKVKEIAILLDCCHSGALGNVPHVDNHAVLREGISVLTASRATQVSIEVNGGGVFTSLVCDALRGGAADVLGKVTLASVYAYVDQILGPWDQRPLFKAHVSCLTPLRCCEPVVSLDILRLLPTLFPVPDFVFPLNPTFEPDAEPRGHPNEQIFRKLQTMRDARLLVPHGADHLFYAAVHSKACRLTALGRYYWQLAKADRL